MQLEREMGRMRDPVFIIKPRASSRGRGIKLITSISQVPRSNKMLVQQYIHNPLLVDGYKCDIRVYVVVTSWEPLRVYIHEDGLVRFATQKYKAGAKYYKRKHAHITNYSTNKGTKNFVESASESQGSKWSLSAFRRWLREVRQVDDEAVWADMRDQCVRTILACEGRSYQMYKEAQAEGQCYEIWGFDLLLTEDLTPWVIEVNTSPSLSGSGTLDARIKTSLVMDTLNIVRSPAPPSCFLYLRRAVSLPWLTAVWAGCCAGWVRAGGPRGLQSLAAQAAQGQTARGLRLRLRPPLLRIPRRQHHRRPLHHAGRRPQRPTARGCCGRDGWVAA